MPSILHLEDFSAAQLTPRPTSALPDLANPTPPAEEQALAAYDKGYAAGWEDASLAASQSQDKLQTAMANNIEDLGFTYHEARAHVMRSLTPLLNGMLTKLLPRMIRDSLGARIMEEIDSIAQGAADTPIELMVFPDDAPHLKPIVDKITSLPLSLVAESTVPQGQIFLRIGQVEREIDLEGAIASIGQAVSALDELNKETAQHG
ncbi:flagellar biosynthesis protein [Oceaniglobus ichthyenteri]|uniref:flagellar biosynthesis protein n=1 Tax=Oceaniglobus ichthyenteri TaxID=2136177 RepID=UPI000D375723|nr:flagellar biosynthesis protein [Oceaniglobus ichthyenteri]